MKKITLKAPDVTPIVLPPGYRPGRLVALRLGISSRGTGRRPAASFDRVESELAAIRGQEPQPPGRRH
jgi:hypothetical protein